MKSLQKIRIDRENALLMIVDAQNEFCKPGGKRYGETSAKIMPRVIPAIQGLAKRAHSAGIPVVYIQSVRTHREPEFTVFRYEPILKIGTRAVEIVEELKPQAGDTVVQKFSHDPFYKTDLDDALQRLVPDPVRCYAIVTGGATNVCLYHAVMGLYLRNYWTVVLVDSVFYLNEDGNQRALEQFSLPAYPNIFLSRSDLIEVSQSPGKTHSWPTPGT